MMNHEDCGEHNHLHVHVDNPGEIVGDGATATVEIEPAHYSASSFLLPAPGPLPEGADTNLDDPVQILALDLLRKKARLCFTGVGQVILCHTFAQAQSMQQNANQSADEGCLIQSPGTFDVEATGPLWAVAVAGVTNPAPGAPGQVATATGAANSPTTATTVTPTGGAGIIATGVAVSFSAASLNATTLTVSDGTTSVVFAIPSGATSFQATIPATLFKANTAVTAVETAAGAAITSTVNLFYQSQTVNTPTIGILAERRDR